MPWEPSSVLAQKSGLLWQGSSDTRLAEGSGSFTHSSQQTPAQKPSTTPFSTLLLLPLRFTRLRARNVQLESCEPHLDQRPSLMVTSQPVFLASMSVVLLAFAFHGEVSSQRTSFHSYGVMFTL